LVPVQAGQLEVVGVQRNRRAADMVEQSKADVGMACYDQSIVDEGAHLVAIALA